MRISSASRTQSDAVRAGKQDATGMQPQNIFQYFLVFFENESENEKSPEVPDFSSISGLFPLVEISGIEPLTS
ncbi:MAG: hypothetical protein IIZ83_08755 [Oscillospiraceae bacterium]|nr:hypothetical protein [Oscillospiraceae bacterium]